MKVIHGVQKKVIDVPPDHFAEVLSKQGWLQYNEQKAPVLGTMAVTDVEVEEVESIDLNEGQEPIMIQEATKRPRGRPKKATN